MEVATNNDVENVNTESAQQSSNTNDFLNSIGEEFRDNPSLRDFKDINGLAKSYLNVNKMIGKSDIPTDRSTQEEWNRYYNKIGRPESYEKYEYKTDKQIDNDFLNNLKQTFFENGITQKQFQNIIEKYTTLEELQQQNELEELKQQESDFINTFNNEFGDKAEEVKSNVREFVKTNLNEQEQEVINSLNENQTLLLAKMINNIYNKSQIEGKLFYNNSNFSGLSLGEINKKMQELRKNSSMPYELKEYQDLEKEKMTRYSRGERLTTNN